MTTERNVEYDTWASVVAANTTLALYHVWDGGAGTEGDHKSVFLFAGNREFLFRAEVHDNSADEQDWDTNTKASSTAATNELEARALAIGTPIASSFDVDGNQVVVSNPRPGTEKYFYTHNLCDACSWYEGSTAVVEAACTDSGDQTTWDVTGQAAFIDLNHGRVFKEDSIATHDTYNILVEVQTDGTGPWDAQTENSWGQTDNDYTFDYELGEVVFNAAIGVSDLVRVSGYVKGTSLYTLKPTTGKRIKLEYVEVQYMVDIVMTANVIFSIWGLVEVFAPELTPDPYPAGTLIPLVSETYKKIIDFFQESTGPYPVIPSHGGPHVVEEVVGSENIQAKLDEGYHVLSIVKAGQNWEALMEVRTGARTMALDLITIPFNYLAYRDIRADAGMELRVTIDGDAPLGGTFAGVTFYSTIEDIV